MDAGQKTPSRENVASMFDSISTVYDRTNRVISFGSDPWFRRKLIHTIPKDRPLILLDVATGTCDQLIATLKKRPNVTKAFGIDLSEHMLRVGVKKVFKNGFGKQVELKVMDAESPTFPPCTFDIATLSFGIRNFKDPLKGLKAIIDLLKSKGTVHILEFSLPTFPLFRPIFLFYLRHILPFLGGLFTSHREAYRYLNATIETFPQRAEFAVLLKEAGFEDVQFSSHFLGIVTIYTGKKP